MDNSENRNSGGHLVMFSDRIGNTVIYWKSGNTGSAGMDAANLPKND